MKEIQHIIQAYQRIDFQKNKAALATVVRVEGSSYRRVGARMLVQDSGEWVGGISGGCLEGDALKKARLAIAQNKAAIVTYDTTDNDPFQIGVGLGCNGIIDVLLTPLNPGDAKNPIELLKKRVYQRQPSVLSTVVGVKGISDWDLGDTGDLLEKAPIFAEGRTNVLTSQRSVTQTYSINNAQVKVLHEFLPPNMHLLIFGGNYDIYAMTRMAKELGWQVSVYCNPQKVQPALFTLADAVLSNQDISLTIDAHTVAILMAHDYETDFRHLKLLLQTPIAYIGLLGPKKRTDKMIQAMQETQTPLSSSGLERMASPVGLDIGASTPEEIALSVLAEIKSLFTNRNGARLKYREKPIYEE